ncbi:hypothetical protein K504DRAFT_66760 [Pleomassaria siparia CBS 279.74]|uniref:Uncharacterized protein n=1 Tax=Pleomassaria siparia CBS 279.74 TaxID=1314801 RepID=A0A6G1K225_9PLEO|nr:hypothetical protein K504DRAFT_66760 [Pleomassaria siparia CBS 279.74]
MHFETSPSSSPAKSIPISFRTTSSPSSSIFSAYAKESTSYSHQGSTSACAYPSWPAGKSLEYRNTPSSFISDEDLFGDDFEDGLLHEAPAPPRQPPMAQAFPILPPLYASEKPKKQRRRSSGRKQRRPSKPMSVISESPEAV